MCSMVLGELKNSFGHPTTHCSWFWYSSMVSPRFLSCDYQRVSLSQPHHVGLIENGVPPTIWCFIITSPGFPYCPRLGWRGNLPKTAGRPLVLPHRQLSKRRPKSWSRGGGAETCHRGGGEGRSGGVPGTTHPHSPLGANRCLKGGRERFLTSSMCF